MTCAAAAIIVQDRQSLQIRRGTGEESQARIELIHIGRVRAQDWADTVQKLVTGGALEVNQDYSVKVKLSQNG